MRGGSSTGDPRVAELIGLCRSLRKGGGSRPRYTEPIKVLVRQLVHSGCDLETISTLARIPSQTVRKWLKTNTPHPIKQQVQMLRLETPSQPTEHRRVLMAVKTGNLEISVYLVGKEVGT